MKKSNQWRSKVNTMQCITRITGILCLTITATFAADWPQYRGTNQDGISTEKLNPVWPPEGPKLVWKVPISNGFSSFAVSGDKAFTLISRNTNGEMREFCVALDAATGKELWAADITLVKYQKYSDMAGEKGGEGPCTTPVVNDGKVYVYSTDLKLCCFDAQTGKELWRVDVLKDHAGKKAFWGNTQSPVVYGDLVFVVGGGPGQSILAINKNTGQVVWKTGDARCDYNTPVVTTILGERQVVFSLVYDLMGVSVKDGKTLWRQGVLWNEATASQPVVCEDKVHYGSAYSNSGVYQIIKEDDGFYGKKLWQQSGHDSSPYISTPVLLNGHLYGAFGWKTKIQFKCIEFATGKVKWAQPGFGFSAGDILVGDKLVVLAETGELVLIDPNPDAYKELARFNAIGGKCYSTPAFSNGRIYIRSVKEAACYDVSPK